MKNNRSVFYGVEYTVLTLINLIAFTIVVGLMPSSVAIAFDGMKVTGVGDPWWMMAFPSASVLLAVGVWLSMVAKKGKRYSILGLILMIVGSLLVLVGWTFIALAKSGVEVGATAVFPYELVLGGLVGLASVFFAHFLKKKTAKWLSFGFGLSILVESVILGVLGLGSACMITTGILFGVGAVLVILVGNGVLGNK